MESGTLLRDLVVLVTVAIPVVAVAQRFRIPTIVGFLLTGLAVGPFGFGLIAEPDEVAGLAELGVVLLLFAIGLELSLSRLISMGKLLLQAGGLQVGATMGVVAGGMMAIGRPPAEAVLVGALAAFSSTAIVLKQYTDRGELDTPHGRLAVAVLIFQDLAIVPVLVFLPALGAGGALPLDAMGRIVVSLGVLVALVAAARFVVPWVLGHIIGLKNREIFTLAIAFFGLLAAYVSIELGLKPAIGAFLAGLVISESEYGLQAMSDVLPFRDLFSGVFFISVGMLLDVRFVGANLALLVGVTAGLALLKAVVVTVVGLAVRRSLEVSVVAGLGLAQVGEFSFVLSTAAEPYGILSSRMSQIFLGASALSMFVAPFLIAVSRPAAERLVRWFGVRPRERLPHEGSQVQRMTDHALIVGYGVAGRYLARVLRAAGFPYCILEQNGQLVRTARAEGEPIFFGDGTRREVLRRFGVERARVIVYSISAPVEERRGVATARELNPNIYIIVRTRYLRAIDELEQLGASDVVVEEYESALELFAKVLARYDIPLETVHDEVEVLRDRHYGLFRGGATPADFRERVLRQLEVQNALHVVDVEAGSRAVGGSPVSLNIRRTTEAVVVACIRDGTPIYTPDPEFAFAPGDAVVVVGDREAFERASALFRASSEPEATPGVADASRAQ